MATDRVREILSWYGSDNPGVKGNLYRLMNTGRLAGTGKLVILPVDQGFEHGPARSFAPNPVGYDPRYHFELALAAGCNAYAAPIGALEAGVDTFAGQVPLILKMNSNNSLLGGANPDQSVNATVEDALRLGCSAIGFTMYPGSVYAQGMYEELRELTLEAKSVGLPVVVWSYARGQELDKDAETAIDVISYAAHIACQMGAHIVKVKPPTGHFHLDSAKKAYQSAGIKLETLSDRIADVVKSCFSGRRIVIFSGGAAKGTDAVLTEIREIAKGGGFGSIMGRNAFQRPKAEAVQLLNAIQDIYAKA